MSFSAALRADIVPDALFTFPTQTEYVEYDNLASLRTLPSYNSLRQDFSGKQLEEAKSVLEQLGIRESQVQEVITGSSSTGLYGLMAGQFDSESITKSARSKRYAAKLLDRETFCAGRETCIMFLENSLAAFGSIVHLKAMLQARQGVLTRLSANSDAVRLLNSTDRSSPLRGILFGEQLKAAIPALVHDWSSWKIDVSRLPSIRTVAYSVTFDAKAHVSATLECASGIAATSLSQMLGVLGTLQ